jgi:hypothetical protein
MPSVPNGPNGFELPDDYAAPGTLFGLSLWQPWATFAATSDPARRDGKPAKEWETRSWYPKILPEQLALHATLGIPPKERAYVSTGHHFKAPYGNILERLGYAPLDPWSPHYETRLAEYEALRTDSREGRMRPLALGCIVALCRIAIVYRAEKAAELIGEERRFQEIALGNYAIGRYAWRLADVRALPEPIPCTGAQQLWRVPAPIAAAVRAAVGVPAVL